MGGHFFFVIYDDITIISNLKSKLKARIVDPAAKIVEIEVTDNDPSKASDIARTIAEKFIEFDKEKQTESGDRVLSFIDNQLEDVTNNLRDVEQQFQEFKTKMKFITPDKG